MLIIKNVIIGIDGGCFDQINPLIKKNLLPNFKKMINDGFSAKLNVTIPPITVPSWPCLFSGITPNQLGFSYFSDPKKGLFNSNFWRDYSIFSIPFLRSFVLNVPGTYPAWRINGEMFSGLMSPILTCYPKELEVIYRRNWVYESQNLSENFKSFYMKKRLFIRKLKEDFDLLIFVIRLPDGISHVAKVGLKKMLDYIYFSYIKIDNFLGELLKEKEIGNIVIFSDHGLSVYKKVIYLQFWLNKKKLFHIISELKDNLLRNILLKIYDLIRPLLKPSSNLIKIYEKLFKPKKPKEKKPKKNKSQISKSKSFLLKTYKSNVGGLFLYGEEKLKKNLIEAELKKERFIKKIIPTESEISPDFYIILKDNYYFDDKPSLFLKRRTNILTHSLQGIFIAYGRDIKKGSMNAINYYDIAPTILKLFSFEKQDYMVGTPLNIFKNKYT